MNWLAVLLSLAALGGSATPGELQARKHCSKAAKHCKTVKPKPKKHPKAKVKPHTTPAPAATPGEGAPATHGSEPSATPAPKPGATATPTPSATATPTATATPVATPPVTYPSRTGVDLYEWNIRPSYRTLAAGRVVFSAANLGEDDHNLSVRSGGHDYGGLDLPPGDTAALVLQLSAGTYTLYCSLIGHEDAGMRTDITVR